jgi:anti-sigma B factor antagonist
MDTTPLWQMEIASDDASGAVAVSLVGEFDITTADQLRETFLRPEVIAATQVTVDLSQVSFVDSSAIGVLVSACKRARSGEATFKIICGSGPARHTLEIAALLDYFEVEPIKG